ncbi:tRNA-splicing endonuclease subunit Sen15 isoform X1 [Myripristis murdjan]|uniref:TSEN15 tRNA splicing endonuclease subunit n=1 Tax=Myripristis murdjan TaxID=586833 RepID=A0A667ZI95_9TELE|nr:tRNA-splicing endonuclease subunit Sen15 isoform X1 [Myripristis murdjan]
MSSASDRAEEKPAAPGWMVQHPMYQHMRSLEVGDEAQVHAAFLVYMDLAEVRQWKDVSGVKCPELQVVLLEGREKDGAPIQTVLPLPVHRSLSHKSIRLALDRGAPVLLCAVASDSTLVYQRMTDGLVTPDPPVGPIQDLGRRQHRKRRQQH